MSTFRSWTTGKVTDLRAQELWLKGFWELNSRMTVLKTDVQGMENGETLQWYLDEQHRLIEAALTELTYVTWRKDMNYPVNPETGASYNEMPYPQDRFSLYVTTWVEERVSEVRATVESGGVDPDKPWTIGQWFAEDESMARSFLLRVTAGLWLPNNLIEPATLQARRVMEERIRGEIGKGYESGGQWDAFIIQVYEEARETMLELGKLWIQGGQEGLGREFENLSDIVERSGERVYEEGVIYRALGISCSEAIAMLRELDLMIPDVRAEEAERFHAVYMAFDTYGQQMCADVEAPTGTPPYQTHLSMSTGRIENKLLEELETRWKMKPWAAVHELAAERNRDQELSVMLEGERGVIISMIEELVADPWTGPLSRNANGRTVPYAGLPVGEEMYVGWVHGVVDATYDRLYAWASSVEPAERTGEYVVAPEYVESLLTIFENLWYNNAVRGLRLMSDWRVGASVIDKFWNEFAGYLVGMEGARFNSIDEFQSQAVAAFETSVQRARDQEREMKESAVEELPQRFNDIESLVSGRSGMDPSEATALVMELEEMRLNIPWEEAPRYNAVYETLTGWLQSLSGGVVEIVWRTDTEAFYNDRVAEFLQMTSDDQELDLIYNHGYETAKQKWTGTLWNELLEITGELASAEVNRRRATAVMMAWDEYAAWRVGLYEAATLDMGAIADRIEAGIPITVESVRINELVRLNHEFLQGPTRRLRELMEAEGFEVQGSLVPFARFKPLKSKAGFDVEEYSLEHLEKLLTNWADERLEKGIHIDPKINGYRLTCQVKGGETRIYMEGMTKDYSITFTSLAAALSKLPDVILDGEMIEKEEGKVGTREGLSKYRAADVDDSQLTIMVFDLLYADGKSWVDEPLEKRREALEDYMKEVESDRFELLPTRVVHTREELLEAVEWADQYPASEGAMLKTVDSLYPLGERTTDWAKIKRTADLQVRVLGVDTTKAKDFVPRCGVEYQGEEGIDPAELEKYGGKEYVVLGNSFRTKLKVKPGDKLEVSVTEVVEQDGPRGKRMNWMIPKVKDFSDRPVDTFAYARQVGQLLQASDDQTWGALTRLEQDTLAATSTDVLKGLEVTAWALLAGLNAARLRNYAWSTIQLIRGRLGKWLDARVNDRGIEHRYEIGVAPIVTLQMVIELDGILRGIEDTVDESAPKLRQKAEDLLGMIGGALTSTDEASIEAALETLRTRVEAYLEGLPEEGRNLLEIGKDLAAVEATLSDLARTPPLDMERQATIQVEKLQALANELGSSSSNLSARIETMYLMLDEWLHPTIPTREVRTGIEELNKKYEEAQTQHATDKKMAEFMVSMALLRIERLRRDLTDWQLALFGVVLDLLENLFKTLQSRWKTIFGSSLTRLRKLDFVGGAPAGYLRKTNILQCSDDSAHVIRIGDDVVGDLLTEVERVLAPDGRIEVVAGVHSRKKCMECSKPPKFEVLWAEGMAHAWFCGKHFENWLEEGKGEHLGDVDAVKLVRDGEAAAKWSENKNPNIWNASERSFTGKGKELVAATKLTMEGEKAGTGRTDFMAVEPEKIPVPGMVWLHIKGIEEENRDLLLEKLLKSGDTLNLHLDIRFNWKPEHLEGFSVSPTTPVLVRIDGKPQMTQIANLFVSTDHKAELEINDVVGMEVACDGEWVPVERIGRHKAKETLRVTTRGGYIECTPNHSLFNEAGKAIRAEELSVGDRIQLADTYPALPEDIELSCDLAWVLGYFCADGHCEVRLNGVGDFAISDKNKANLELAQAKLLRLGFETHIAKYPSAPGTWHLKAQSARVIAQWFRMLCYERSLITGVKAEKKVPDVVLRSSKKAKNAFLDGYITGDGHIDACDAITVTSASKLDLAGVMLLASAVGYPEGRLHWCSNQKSAGFFNMRWGKGIASSVENEITKITHYRKQRWVYDLETKSSRFMAGVGRVMAHNTVFIGNENSLDKWEGYAGGKLGCTIKQRQPVVWNNEQELDKRVFPPGTVGNISAKKTYGKMFLLERVSMVPSRMRSEPRGDRYFEFFLTFNKSKELNGLWAVSESAAESVEGIPYFLFKLKTDVPFWKRGAKRHEEEIKEMPKWQRDMALQAHA